ncbi:PREDICTED: P2Y purinoceptor 4 [Nanorana parkeri]|uniref:P2Y purinoceptor 4 n=1 Tax=Nanorana parkeri TaxID=125878 RepID=UPI0008543DED|nr:PREDICTED: P2Y purinoceptor 4 [Nanorana parkeri]
MIWWLLKPNSPQGSKETSELGFEATKSKKPSLGSFLIQRVFSSKTMAVKAILKTQRSIYPWSALYLVVVLFSRMEYEQEILEAPQITLDNSYVAKFIGNGRFIDVLDTMVDHHTTPSLSPLSIQNVTNQTSNICVFDEDFKYFLLPVSYSAVLILGLPLNLTAIWVFFAKMRPWSPTTVYMFNLALADTLYLLSLPTLVYYYADHNNWPFGEVLCKSMRFLFYTNLYCSILFLTCISIHRYMGVCHPLFSLQRMKARYAHMFCVGVWISVSACLIPNLIFVTVSPRGNDTLCHDTTRPEDFKNYVEYSTAVMTLLFGLPFLVIAVCYGLISRELMKPMVNGNCQTLPTYKRKSIKTIIIVFTVFIICFLPFHITRTIYYYARLSDVDCKLLNIINLSYKITRPLASSNSCFDPIFYFLASDNYQKRLVNMVTSISNMCRRHLPVIHRGPTTYKSDGPAVINVQGVQNIRSLGNLLDNNQEANHPDETEVARGANSRNNGQTSAEHGGDDGKAKWRIAGKKLKADGNIGMGVAEDNGGETRKDEGNVVEGIQVLACNDVDIKILRTQSDNIAERKRNKANGEKRRYWSLRGIRGAEESQNKTFESCLYEGEGTSSWNLLDTASQGRQSLYNEEGNSKRKKLHFLPNI